MFPAISPWPAGRTELVLSILRTDKRHTIYCTCVDGHIAYIAHLIVHPARELTQGKHKRRVNTASQSQRRLRKTYQGDHRSSRDVHSRKVHNGSINVLGHGCLTSVDSADTLLARMTRCLRFLSTVDFRRIAWVAVLLGACGELYNL